MKRIMCLFLVVVLLGCDKSVPTEQSLKSQATEFVIINNSQSTPSESPASSLSLDIDFPLVVIVDGIEYTDFKGIIKGEILFLYQGESSTDYKQEINFWHVPDTYRGKVLIYPDPEEPYNSVNMSYDKKDPSVNISMEWLKEFYYKLELGLEKDYKIPVKINAKVTSPYQITVQGKIDVATAGIRMTDGVIDRSFDDLDTIEWLTKDWILKNTSAKIIAKSHDTCFMETYSENKKKDVRQVAACSFLYTDDFSDLKVAKLWLEKLENQWQVVKRTPSNKLISADPIKPPFRNKPPYIFDVLAADKFSESIYKENDGHINISETAVFPCGGGQASDQPGWCELPYKYYESNRNIGDDIESQCKFITYLFEKNKDGEWDISKEIEDHKKYDYRNQKVIPRDEDSRWGC